MGDPRMLDTGDVPTCITLASKGLKLRFRINSCSSVYLAWLFLHSLSDLPGSAWSMWQASQL